MTDPTQCPFCEIIAGRAPAGMIREWPTAIAIRPLDPVVSGHVLVIPRQHVEDFTSDVYASIIAVTHAAELGAELDIPMNLITSKGPEATQTVPHLHIHLVPRHEGDGLPLPWDPHPAGHARSLRAKCGRCGRDRDPVRYAADRYDYNLFQAALGPFLGWYQGDDGQFCGPCIRALMGPPTTNEKDAHDAT